MASFSKELGSLKYKTFSEIKYFSEQILRVGKFFNPKKVQIHYNFKVGGLNCIAKSLEEFVEIAYGNEDFKLIALQFYFSLPDNNHIVVNYLCGFSVSASSKVLLDKYIEELHIEEHSSNTETEKQELNTNHNNTTIIINGNGNIVANADSNISNIKTDCNEEKNKNESSVKIFLSGVLQEVTANVIWWLLGIIGTIIIGYISINC